MVCLLLLLVPVVVLIELFLDLVELDVEDDVDSSLDVLDHMVDFHLVDGLVLFLQELG